MERTCLHCPYLSPTEAEQEQLRKWGLEASQHVCDLFHRIVKHKENSLDIIPCKECVSAPFEEANFDGCSHMPLLQREDESHYEPAYQ